MVEAEGVAEVVQEEGEEDANNDHLIALPSFVSPSLFFSLFVCYACTFNFYTSSFLSRSPETISHFQ